MSRSERGVTVVEALVMTVVVAFAVTTAGIAALSWIRSERHRSALYQVYIHMTLARAEATARNRDCRFTIDTATRTIRVEDLHDPSTDADDQEIASTTLDSGVLFGRPDSVPAVTLPLLSGTSFGVTFGSDGALITGGGAIGLSDRVFRRLTVHAAGAVALERWNGSAWVAGS